MKNIFLDCGTHLCEGIIKFYNAGIINDSFEIHAFEANPACMIGQRVKKIPLNIYPHEAAVWVDDGFVAFNQENHLKSGTGSPSDGYSHVDGWGSSVAGIGFEHLGYDSNVITPSINFSRFLNELPHDANIVCKMDIEGSEFRVLRHLIKEGSIRRLSSIYVEFHSRFMPAETSATEKDLVDAISSLGVKVFTWF